MSSNENVDAFDTLMQAYTPEDAGGEPEVEVVEEAEDDGEDSTAAQEDETPETEVESDEDPEESDEAPEDEAPEDHKKGKKSARERINEVIAQRRQAERERDAERTQREALEARIRALEEGKTKPAPDSDKPTYTPAGDEFGLKEPTADDVGDDGQPKYPLGEFDPRFVRDLSRYDRAVERAYEAKVAAEQATQTAAQREAEALFVEWNQKVAAAEATSPDIRQKAESLEETFKDVPAEHGQALAQTIMSLDNGPFVLEYLADNLDEADRIVRMPLQKALIQLGRLDGLFIEEPKAPPVKATKAPPPPAALARGRGTPSAGGQKSLYDKMLSDFR